MSNEQQIAVEHNTFDENMLPPYLPHIVFIELERNL